MLDSLEVIMESGVRSCDGAAAAEMSSLTTAAAVITPLAFHENHGRNVQFRDEERVTAFRSDSYNQGIVISNRPLKTDEVFQVRIDKLNQRWSSSLSIGVVAFPSQGGCAGDQRPSFHLPITALGLKKKAVVLSGDGGLYVNGQKVKEDKKAVLPRQDASASGGEDDKAAGAWKRLESLEVGACVGVSVDHAHNRVRIHFRKSDEEEEEEVMVLCKNSQFSGCHQVYGLIDLYGQCEQVSIVKQQRISDAMTSLGSGNDDVINTKGGQHSSGGCSYFKLCQKFLKSLALPHQYFAGTTKSPRCFCQQCFGCDVIGGGSSASDVTRRKGEPGKEYALPIGWVHFPIVQRPHRQQHQAQTKTCSNSLDRQTPATAPHAQESVDSNSCRGNQSTGTIDWHRAYHGSKPGMVRKLLDNGELVPIVELGLEGTRRINRRGCGTSLSKESKEDSSDTAQLLFSPTLKYVGNNGALCPTITSDCLAQPPRRGGGRGSTATKRVKVKVAFEVDVHPGSYKVGPPTMLPPSAAAAPEKIDAHFKPDEVEWLTKERGNTVITGILVHVTPFT